MNSSVTDQREVSGFGGESFTRAVQEIQPTVSELAWADVSLNAKRIADVVFMIIEGA